MEKSPIGWKNIYESNTRITFMNKKNPNDRVFVRYVKQKDGNYYWEAGYFNKNITGYKKIMSYKIKNYALQDAYNHMEIKQLKSEGVLK